MKSEHNEALSNATPSDSRMGRLAYEAYFNQRSGKTHDGKDMPAWDALGDVQAGWDAAARAVATECINGRYHF